MATTNYGWILPTPDGSPGVWGTMLNDIIGDSTTIDPIDTVVNAISVVADAALARTGGTMAGLIIHDICRETIEPIAVLEIDWDTGNVFTKSISEVSTFTFAGTIDSGTAQFISVRVTSTGNYAVTWPATVKWHNGSAPFQTASGTDLYVFYAEAGIIYGARTLEDAS